MFEFKVGEVVVFVDELGMSRQGRVIAGRTSRLDDESYLVSFKGKKKNEEKWMKGLDLKIFSRKVLKGLSPDEVVVDEACLDELIASEALFAFAGWLTSRKERTIMSSHDNAAIVAELVGEFIKRNNLTPPSEDFADKIVPPEKSKEKEDHKEMGGIGGSGGESGAANRAIKDLRGTVVFRGITVREAVSNAKEFADIVGSIYEKKRR